MSRKNKKELKKRLIEIINLSADNALSIKTVIKDLNW